MSELSVFVRRHFGHYFYSGNINYLKKYFDIFERVLPISVEYLSGERMMKIYLMGKNEKNRYVKFKLNNRNVRYKIKLTEFIGFKNFNSQFRVQQWLLINSENSRRCSKNLILPAVQVARADPANHVPRRFRGRLCELFKFLINPRNFVNNNYVRSSCCRCYYCF